MSAHIKPEWVICQNFIAIVSKLFDVKVSSSLLAVTPLASLRAQPASSGQRLARHARTYSPFGSTCRLQLRRAGRNTVDVLQDHTRKGT